MKHYFFFLVFKETANQTLCLQRLRIFCVSEVINHLLSEGGIITCAEESISTDEFCSSFVTL